MEYKIERKKKKNASIRIDNNGLVIVSVPSYFTDKMISDFILKYDSWIKKNMVKAIDPTTNQQIFEGSTIYLLGDRYIVRIILDKSRCVEIKDGFIYIYSDDLDLKIIDKIYSNYLKDLTLTTYKGIVDKYLNLTKLSINKLTIRSLKRTYGKCYFERKEIILSRSLIYKRIEFIEAVIMHEVAHLKYPNHQKEFYNFINKYMPDYKERMKNKIK